MKRGSLIVVGAGISLAAHCSQEARYWITTADIVFSVMGNPIAQRWLEGLNARTVSLQTAYKHAPNRPAAYAAMTARILAPLRKGKTVCAVFYGHPGVLVTPSHAAIRQARAEGFEAQMLPGISAEACLIADLGVDPVFGWQSYEAHDFFIHARVFDPTAALILWQIAVAGDETFTELEAKPDRLRALAVALMDHYPGGHFVTMYEAASMPTARPKIQQMALRDLHKATVTQASTLYVPPLGAPRRSGKRAALLKACSDQAHARLELVSPVST